MMDNKSYGILSNESIWKITVLTNEDNYGLLEGTDREINSMAREDGYKFIHWYNSSEDDYGNVSYYFISSTIV